jgi:hypothetical protein
MGTAKWFKPTWLDEQVGEDVAKLAVGKQTF